MNRKYDEVKCIWADSGIIGYKLCDKNFDCENCELDRVLRKTASAYTEAEQNSKSPNNIIDEVISEINSLKFDKHYVSLENYLCLKNLFGDKYFLGISPLLYSLFYRSEGSFNCVKEYNINAGEKIAEISGTWGSNNIASPIVMKVLKQIPQKNGEVNSTNWIGIVEVEKQDFNPSSIDSNQFEQNKNFIISLLNAKGNEALNTLGTMYDGGKKVKNLPEFLGEKEFCSFVDQIIKAS